MKTTMKRHSFTTRLKSLAVVFGIALTFASCANEDVAQNPTTNPNEDNDKNLTTFVAGDEAKTRTSLDYTSSNFSWEAGDYIYVKDDNNVLRKSSNAPTSKVASFKYKVPGKFTAHTSYKVYYLGKNSNGSRVTISTTQTQTKPDNTEHFGTAGDYGTATANKVTGKNQFEFELEHQPAYLVFQPYTSNTILQNCYLTKVEVTSDNDIAETYTINTSTGTLTGSAGDKKIILTTKDGIWGSTYYNGFPLNNNSASVTTNGAYMVIKPGTHILRVRYWIKDIATNVEGTITKTLPATAYASNTYYDMTANLNVRNYDGDKYYMWDAQQNYWAGHEWNSATPWQPTLNGQHNLNYPKNNSDSRWYHEGTLKPFNATQSCAICPNANEMSWYVGKGDPHWDKDELWTTMGHLYKGGMWLLKKSKIAGYRNDKSYRGPDYRMQSEYDTYSSISQGPPSVAEASDYFYLPALGRYEGAGSINTLGVMGGYWSSNADPERFNSAYYLSFTNSIIIIQYNNVRSTGYRVQAFE